MELLVIGILIYWYYKRSIKKLKEDCKKGIYHKSDAFGPVYYEDQYGNDWTAAEIERYKRTGYAWQLDPRFNQGFDQEFNQSAFQQEDFETDRKTKNMRFYANLFEGMQDDINMGK